jgi:hypothetical protein
MSITAIKTALESKLNALTPALATAWEGITFVPVTGTPYQQVNLLPSDTVNPSIGDGHYREKGILQVTLCYPLKSPSETGTKPTLQRADLLCTHFKRGTTILDTTTVKCSVYKSPHIAQCFIDGDRIRLPVSIYWQADIF